MQFQQGNNHAGKVRLEAKEHFILANFISRLPIYVLMWAVCLIASWLLSNGLWSQPVMDYAGMRAFSIAFVTIATTTITFAIPTCMRAIFSTYEQYYSTKISEILLNRFPVTLLTLSAFTSLLVSVSIVSGIVGIAIPVSPAAAFYVALFWTLVCIFYLFVAIEKMVYFIANAPYAVIEKLEYGVSATPEITTKQEYDNFRQELASINDIASTIISRSTGYDGTITETLSAFQQIHKHYLITADASNPTQFRFHINACRAVGHEIVRIFRTACSVKNEKACDNIVKTYCAMLSDALDVDTGIGYFSDMMDQITKLQSYATASSVEELKIIASVNWFFILADIASASSADSSKHQAKNAIIVRTLIATLRTATEAKDDAIIVKFLRIASNSEIDFDVTKLSPIWQDMLDRAVFVYSTWLIDLMPADAERFLEYIKRYSRPASAIFRSVLPDNEERMRQLMMYENLLRLHSVTAEGDRVSKVADGRTAMVLSMSLDSTAAHTMMLMVLLDRNDMGLSSVEEYARLYKNLSKEMEYIQDNECNEEISRRLALASILDEDLASSICNAEGTR